ncbi:MAG: 30S ribosome-binding factor RbfA [Planctomycetes bacterium]|nr:30S ribosome-binding factor RbfA [Planctomycetota bacterium]
MRGKGTGVPAPFSWGAAGKTAGSMVANAATEDIIASEDFKGFSMDEPRGASRRSRRVASVIREVVSRELVTGLSDPRLTLVTVTGVELSADLRFADVRVSVMGDERAQQECFRAIRHAHGRLQEKVAEALVLKFIPALRFHLDQSVKQSVALSALIAKARAEDEARRADRIRRGVEPPAELPPLEESPPVPAPTVKPEARNPNPESNGKPE